MYEDYVLLICSFNPHWPNVELNSTALYVVPGPLSVQIDMLFYRVLCWIFLSSYPVIAAFKIRRLEGFWEINLDQIFGANDNNLDCTELMNILKLLSMSLTYSKCIGESE